MLFMGHGSMDDTWEIYLTHLLLLQRIGEKIIREINEGIKSSLRKLLPLPVVSPFNATLLG
jgi:hypothetical protein